MIQDEPTTFWFDDKPYEPANFEHKFYGAVPLRDALAHSLNVAAVKVAEEIGYGEVVDLARRAGLNLDIQPTPAIALGAYEVTPLEIAGAYTIFANHGIYSSRASSRPSRPTAARRFSTTSRSIATVLDPRVAFLMDSCSKKWCAAVPARAFGRADSISRWRARPERRMTAGSPGSPPS